MGTCSSMHSILHMNGLHHSNFGKPTLTIHFVVGSDNVGAVTNWDACYAASPAFEMIKHSVSVSISQDKHFTIRSIVMHDVFAVLPLNFSPVTGTCNETTLPSHQCQTSWYMLRGMPDR